MQTRNFLKESSSTIVQLQKHLPKILKNRLQSEQNQLDQLEKICRLLAPEAALKRGFSITSSNGKIITNSTEVKTGAILKTQLQTGTIKSKVIK